MPPKKRSSGLPKDHPALGALPLAASASTFPQGNPTGSSESLGTRNFLQGSEPSPKGSEAEQPNQPGEESQQSSLDSTELSSRDKITSPTSTRKAAGRSADHLGGLQVPSEASEPARPKLAAEDDESEQPIQQDTSMDRGDNNPKPGLGSDKGNKPAALQGHDMDLEGLSRALPQAPSAQPQDKAAEMRAAMKQFFAKKKADSEASKHPWETSPDFAARDTTRKKTLVATQKAVNQPTGSACSSYAQAAAGSSKGKLFDSINSPQPTTEAPIKVHSAASPVKRVNAPSRPSRHPEVPYKELLNYGVASGKKIKVAVCVSEKSSDKPDHIFGNPFSATKGMVVYFQPDAGRYGDPSITLKVRINKEHRDEDLSSYALDTNSASISWYPGVQYGGYRNMEKLEIRTALEDSDEAVTLPSAIKKLCPWDKQTLLAKIVAVSFHSWSHIENHRYEPEWGAGLSKETEQSLHDLFRIQRERTITLWFVNPVKDNDVVKRNLLRPIQSAVEMCREPFAQYYSDDFVLDTDLDAYPTIEETGDGMYKKAASPGDKRNRGMVATPDYDVLPLKHYWKTLQEFDIYGTMHVVRNRQHLKAQCASIGRIGSLAPLQNFSDTELEPKHLSDLETERRHLKHDLVETNAVHHMADANYERESLSLIRNAIISDPDETVLEQIDLTEGNGTDDEKAANRRTYEDFIMPHLSNENLPRNEVLHSVQNLKNKIVLVVGGPGTLKTATIAIMICGLIISGQRILFVAASNAAVDSTAAVVQSMLPAGKTVVRIGTTYNMSENSWAVQEADSVFTTCVTSGCGQLPKHFDPDIVCVDELDQLTVPTFCVPLTAYKTWKGLLLFGDTIQLKPKVASSGMNEFVENSKLSPMDLLMSKGFSHIRLKVQYRSDPEISKFPSVQFYGEGELVSHPSTNADSITKQKLRAVSVNYYGIKKDQGGSTYFFVDVPYGASRTEQNGSSQHNHANAGAISDCIRDLLIEGVRGDQISILALYKGQTLTLQNKIHYALGPEAEQGHRDWVAEVKKVTIGTVDSFRGRESDIILVDTVTATDQYYALKMRNLNVCATISGHVKEASRLNLALTRAKYGCIVFGQAAALLAAANKRSKISNSISLMMADAFDRQLVSIDVVNQDPQATQNRSVNKDKEEAKNTNGIWWRFAKEATENAQDILGHGEVIRAPTIHTPEGETTHLISLHRNPGR